MLKTQNTNNNQTIKCKTSNTPTCRLINNVFRILIVNHVFIEQYSKFYLKIFSWVLLFSRNINE